MARRSSLGDDALLDIEEFTQQPFKDDFSPADATAEPSTSTTKLKLARGELVGKVAKLKKEQGSTFTVGTPVARRRYSRHDLPDRLPSRWTRESVLLDDDAGR